MAVNDVECCETFQTHQELLKNNPIYQKLYELELKDDEKK